MNLPTSRAPELTLALALQTLDVADRERLRTSVRTLVIQADPSHAPEVIDQALAEVWSRKDPQPPSASGETLACFGWNRPVSEEDRQVRMSGGWRGALDRTMERWFGRSGWGAVGVTAGWLLIPAALTIGLERLTASLWGLNSSGASTTLAGLFGLMFTFGFLGHLSKRARRSRALAWFKGNLQASPKDYLAFPTTRAYLRSVLGSGLPDLMQEDADRLEALYQEAVVARREAELRAQQHARQIEQEKEREHRMRLFAEGLANPSAD